MTNSIPRSFLLKMHVWYFHFHKISNRWIRKRHLRSKMRSKDPVLPWSLLALPLLCHRHHRFWIDHRKFLSKEPTVLANTPEKDHQTCKWPHPDRSIFHISTVKPYELDRMHQSKHENTSIKHLCHTNSWLLTHPMKDLPYSRSVRRSAVAIQTKNSFHYSASFC